VSARSGRTALAVVVSTVVAIAVAWGMWLVGTPAEERDRRLDERRLEDLRTLRQLVHAHHEATGRLPLGLEDLVDARGRPVERIDDPAGRGAYDYEAVDSTSFRLCATFDFATPDEPARNRLDPWAHGAGRQCFRFRLGQVEGGRKDDAPLEPVLERRPDSGP
jgi:hypothetical protein